MDNNIRTCSLTAAPEYYDRYKHKYDRLQKECFTAKPFTFSSLAKTLDAILN